MASEDSFSAFEHLGVKVPKILFPNKSVDLNKWAIIACDQFTSQADYWINVKKHVNDFPSTLNMVLPELYLNENDVDERLISIYEHMEKYINNNILIEYEPCLIYVERKLLSGIRKGLMLLIDLEKYDFQPGSESLIRATEEVVENRLPPRVRIRKNALIETPHALMLFDDNKKSVIEPLSRIKNTFEKLYDFELMFDGGHITGYKISDEKIILDIFKNLEKLCDKNSFNKRYNLDIDKQPLLFAVGDGNHSLASAKVLWEDIKKDLPSNMQSNHPARFALVELVNVNDDSIVFEPIHRIVFDINIDTFFDEIENYFSCLNCPVSIIKETENTNFEDLLANLSKDTNSHQIPFISSQYKGFISVEKPVWNIEAGTLQYFIDKYIEKHLDTKIDYIHERETLETLGKKEGNIGFYLPPMHKSQLFKTVIMNGSLPRKTFSMGEAKEKRYYLECRKIT
mgnify:CR=1 FL=1